MLRYSRMDLIEMLIITFAIGFVFGVAVGWLLA